MRVYRQQQAGMVIVQPGVDFPDKPEWKDSEGSPILFNVKFKAGMANVEEQLGRYLIDQRLASRSPIVIAHP